MSHDDPALYMPDTPSDQHNTDGRPTQPEREYALLVDGRQQYLVRMVNQSPNEFFVVYSGDPVFKDAQVFRLHMKIGVCDVQVAWILSDGKDTQIGLRPVSSPSEKSVGPRSFYTALLIGFIACGMFVVANHFIRHDTNGIADKVPFVNELRELVAP